MKPILIYLLQVIAISGLLYGYYHFFLRNKKFHHYNRFYLLAATVLSFLLPLFEIPVYFEAGPGSTGILETMSVLSGADFEPAQIPDVIQTLPAGRFDWTLVAIGIYQLIMLLAIVRILLSLSRIRKLLRTHKAEKIGKIHFIVTEAEGTPFSFFSWMFWNRRIELDSDRGQQVFRHELFHIRQKHSWDLMFLEIVTAICWINPFFHLTRKELKTLHEFLADRYAAHEENKWEYAELLLMQAFSTRQSLVNPFFHNQIKRRIAMITNSKKTSFQYLRKIMVLPLAFLLLVLFAFNFKKKNSNPVSALEKQVTVVIDAGHGGEDLGATGETGQKEKDIVLAIAKKVQELNDDKQVRILLTRNKDVSQKLKSRTDLANEENADLFISLHANSAPENSVSKKAGIEIYVPRKSAYQAQNVALGTILFNHLNQLIPSTSGLKQSSPTIWVLENTNCPSVLVECGSMSDSEDLAFISNSGNQEKIASQLLMGIKQYFVQQGVAKGTENKQVYRDTTSPVFTIARHPSGKELLQYNGRWVKEVLETKEGQYILRFENENVLISKTQTQDLKTRYGAAVTKLVVQVVDVKARPSKEGDKVFDKVETEPSYPGGDIAWKKYVQEMMPKMIKEANMPSGEYSVVVQFVVDENGNPSDFKALTKHGHGLEEKGIAVTKSVPKWNPAIQNGHKVKAYKKVVLTYTVNIKKKDSV